jgi:uncharacterized lipoprotein
MKKAIQLIIVLSFVAGIVGCGSSSETVESTDSKPTVGTKGKKAGGMESEDGLHPPK